MTDTRVSESFQVKVNVVHLITLSFILVKSRIIIIKNQIVPVQILLDSYKYADSSLDSDSGFVWTNALLTLQWKFPGTEVSEFPYGNFRIILKLKFSGFRYPHEVPSGGKYDH